MKNSMFVALILALLLLSGCLGFTGTKMTARIPDGPEIAYLTDESKQIDGLTITKNSDGSWSVSIDKSSSTPNTLMYEVLGKMADKIPSLGK